MAAAPRVPISYVRKMINKIACAYGERRKGNVRKSIGNNDRAALQAKIIQVAQVDVITTKKQSMGLATRIIAERDNYTVRKTDLVLRK